VVLSTEFVRSEVSRYWEAFTSKDADTLEDFYAHESIGFSSTSTRSEPGRLAAIRRKREYFGNEGTIRSELGTIEVVPLGEQAVVACYTFQFHASRSYLLDRIVEEHIRNGRATQVFGLDTDGHLRIFHEHFSEATG
jgi:hypothetical protein